MTPIQLLRELTGYDQKTVSDMQMVILLHEDLIQTRADVDALLKLTTTLEDVLKSKK